ncbi:MAG: flagellar brake protein [Thermanaerothrix sp.]|nr:flagellar brake protein [Thermanaerothrix sp.]
MISLGRDGEKIGLPVGAKGEFKVEDGLFKGTYPTRLEDQREDMLGLAHPMFKGALLPVYRDMECELVAEDNRSPVRVSCVVVRSDITGTVPMLWVKMFGPPERIQRRRYLRVPCLREFRLFPIEAEARSPLSGRWLKGTAVDMSLGGVRFRMDYPYRLSHGDRFLCMLPLGDRPFPGLIKVMRADKTSDGLWDCGGAFEAVPRWAEKYIIEFIRTQELNSRQGRDVP